MNKIYKIYLLRETQIPETNVLGIFSTREKAEITLKKYKDYTKDKVTDSEFTFYRIDELELDVIEFLRFDDTDNKIHCIKITETKITD